MPLFDNDEYCEVGTSEGSKPRKVLITMEELAKLEGE